MQGQVLDIVQPIIYVMEAPSIDIRNNGEVIIATVQEGKKREKKTLGTSEYSKKYQ